MMLNKRKNVFNEIITFFNSHKAILILMFFLFLVRLCLLYEAGLKYNLESDDLSYIKSAFHFAETGIISMHNEYPSAQIMPGMTVFIALYSILFGQGRLFWLALKFTWIAMGTLCAWFIYKTVTSFTPKWCGIVAALPLFRPDYIWMDNLILTETPFLLFLLMMVYYTIKMGESKGGYKNFILCAVAYFLALMLKANIAPYPVFALIYLLILKYDRKVLLKQCVILACAVLCFVIPWSIRNYKTFDEFVPLTYGSGNPTLLGTYQGVGYPLDEELDYETNVDKVWREKYAKHFNEDGSMKEEMAKYLELQHDAVKASYRQKEWIKRDPGSFLYSLLVIKPQYMMNSVFYWRTSLGIDAKIIEHLPYIEMIICILILVASIYLKKYRAPIFYASAVYLGNIYIYATTFSFDRYNASLNYLRYIVIGIGISLILQLIVKGYKAIVEHEAMINSKKENDEIIS